MNVRELIEALQELLEREPHRETQTVFMSAERIDEEDGEPWMVAVRIERLTFDGTSVSLEQEFAA